MRHPYYLGLVLLCLTFSCATTRAPAPTDPATTTSKDVYVPPPIPQPTFTPTAPAAPPSTASESVGNSITNYLPPTDFQLGDLNAVVSPGGSSTLAATASVFGQPGVTVTATLRADLTTSHLQFSFPAAAQASLSSFDKLLGGTSLSRYLPPGFPTDQPVALRTMTIDFAENGYVIEQLSAELGTADYRMPAPLPLTVSGARLDLEAVRPTQMGRTIGGTISGTAKLGQTNVQVAATLNSDPNQIDFTGSLTELSLSILLDALATGPETRRLVTLLPPPLKSLSLSTIAVSARPFAKILSTRGSTSMGDAELQLDGSGPRANLIFGLAPPATFDYGSIHGLLTPLNQLDLGGTSFVVSALPDKSVELALPSLAAMNDLAVAEGVNLIADLKFSEGLSDIGDMLNLESARLTGTLSRNLDHGSFTADLDQTLKLNEDGTVELGDINLFTRLGAQTGLEFGLAGLLRAQVDRDLLGFNASFKVNALDQSLAGEFFLEALNPPVAARRATDFLTRNEEAIPEWTEPFGIPGVGIRKLGGSAGISPRSPILLSSLGLTGAARLGTVRNRKKHLTGALTVALNVANPAKSLLSIEVNRITPLGMIDAFVESHGIKGSLRDVLGSGLEDGKVLIVPTDNLTLFGVTYQRGVAFGAAMNLLGVKGRMDCSMNDAGVSGRGSLDPINLAGGQLAVRGIGRPGPLVAFDVSTGRLPTFEVDGEATLLGFTAGTRMLVDGEGFEMLMRGSFLDDLEGIFEVKGKLNSNQGTGIALRVAMRNEFLARITREATAALDKASRDARQTLLANRRKLENQRKAVRRLDKQIVAREAAVKAAWQRERDKANAIYNSQIVVVRDFNRKIKDLQKKIDKLGNWPHELAEKAVLETRKITMQAGRESAKATLAVYAQAVNKIADLSDVLPNDPELISLHTQKGAANAALTIATTGVDVVIGVSQGTIDAAKFMIDNTIGAFDLRSMEFATSLGFGNEFTASVDMNLVFTGNNHNLRMEFDFADIPGSVAKLVGKLTTGNALKPGFGETFGKGLESKLTARTVAR
ncbi:hypothetical protein GGR28_002049 [Lewinella aquimaris]|uniref:AsmA-like C-terminal domain-containing protein n=1 Tax=Neolewinella aquimaris TaxID=1835722 RepID=A0A840ECA3_9BACT|nr:hypothetical protein [Neolewinella aquimaris]MBB4079429.1 hypothetical protein [Neolewinella aquimaris]